MRRIGLVVIVMLSVLAVPGLGAPAGAITSSDLDVIAADLAASGRYLEFASNDSLEASIDDANARGIAFAWLDIDVDDAEAQAAELVDRLEGSPYRTVVVLTNTSIAAFSSTADEIAIERALSASSPEFQAGAVADAVASFSDALVGDAATTATTTGAATPSGASSGDDGGGGIGLGTILLLALVGGGGFLLFRNLRARSKARREAEADLESDRAEIKEQLRDNADHVLELGDRVIAADQPELITTYEQASAAYQEVSREVDGASTAEEIDRLDDLIDDAEWKFESIEADLEGRPPPPSPAEVEAQAEASARAGDGQASNGPTPPAPAPSGNDGPALGPDDSIFGESRSRRPVPTPRSGRRSGGGMGGVLGSILGSIVLGGGGIPGMGGAGSRRTRRRRSRIPSGGSMHRGSTRSGGLGGGVLRRGSGSSARRGAGGSRPIRRRGSGGSRKL